MIPHSRPTIDADSVAAVLKTVRSSQLAMGPQVGKFERVFSQRLGVHGAAAVASGTAGLHLALLGLGVKKGDEVIIPTHVCTALLNAVHYTGATPVLADVDPSDANISATHVSTLISRRTKAIIVPHMFGFPADLASLLKLGIPLIEDCAQALGAQYAQRPVGTFGKMGVFSFYATKMIATGKGGMVVSRDRKVVEEIRDLAAYDNKPDYKIRFNYKMTDVEAALGLAQLKQLGVFISRRKKIAACYDKAFKDLPCVLPIKAKGVDPVYYRYVMRIRCGADEFVLAMKKKGICCERPLFRPLHQYMKVKGFPVSDQWMTESVSLPIYPSMTQAQVQRVVREVQCMLSHKDGYS